MDHRRDGRGAVACDGAEPADRRSASTPANPRTARRELPSGAAPSVAGRRSSASASLAVFLIAVWQLDPIVRWLWPIPVAGFVVYPYLKRVTWLSHLWLGAVDGLAPVGGWVAVTGELALGGVGARRGSRLLGRGLRPLLRAAWMSSSTASTGLQSWATRFGERGDVPRARACCTRRRLPCSLLPGSGWRSESATGPGVVAVALLLVYEHSLVRPGDLRRLDAAFFTVNGVISLVFCAFVLIDVL